jgi:hypothetical protein
LIHYPGSFVSQYRDYTISDMIFYFTGTANQRSLNSRSCRMKILSPGTSIQPTTILPAVDPAPLFKKESDTGILTLSAQSINWNTPASREEHQSITGKCANRQVKAKITGMFLPYQPGILYPDVH